MSPGEPSQLGPWPHRPQRPPHARARAPAPREAAPAPSPAAARPAEPPALRTLVRCSLPPEPLVQMIKCLEKRKHCRSPSFFSEREPSRPRVIFPFSDIGTWMRDPTEGRDPSLASPSGPAPRGTVHGSRAPLRARGRAAASASPGGAAALRLAPRATGRAGYRGPGERAGTGHGPHPTRAPTVLLRDQPCPGGQDAPHCFSGSRKSIRAKSTFCSVRQ